MSASELAVARRRLALLAVLTALLVAATAVGHGATLGQRWGTTAYVLATAGALFAPGWITAQVVLGVLLVASLLLGGDQIGPVVALGMVATIVATAELLALVARLEGLGGTRPEVGLRRVGAAAGGAAAVFAVVWVAGALPGPGGITGLLLAAAACLALAVLLGAPPARGGRQRPDGT